MDSDYRSLVLLQACRLHRKLTFSYMRASGITSGQPPLLEMLWQAGGCTQSELSRRCHLEPATITSTLSTMEREGLVERRADPSDRRVWRIFLTERGIKAHQACRETNRAVAESCFEGFSDTEKEQAAEYLRRIAENLGRALGDEQSDEQSGFSETRR